MIPKTTGRLIRVGIAALLTIQSAVALATGALYATEMDGVFEQLGEVSYCVSAGRLPQAVLDAIAQKARVDAERFRYPKAQQDDLWDKGGVVGKTFPANYLKDRCTYVVGNLEEFYPPSAPASRL